MEVAAPAAPAARSFESDSYTPPQAVPCIQTRCGPASSCQSYVRGGSAHFKFCSKSGTELIARPVKLSKNEELEAVGVIPLTVPA